MQGTQFMVPIYSVMRNPQNFEQPNEFIPERFEKEYPFYAYLPFMHGARSCIGTFGAILAIVLSQLHIGYEISPNCFAEVQRSLEKCLDFSNAFSFLSHAIKMCLTRPVQNALSIGGQCL